MMGGVKWQQWCHGGGVGVVQQLSDQWVHISKIDPQQEQQRKNNHAKLLLTCDTLQVKNYHCLTNSVIVGAGKNYWHLTSSIIVVKTTGMAMQSTQIQMRVVKPLDAINSPMYGCLSLVRLHNVSTSVFLVEAIFSRI